MASVTQETIKGDREIGYLEAAMSILDVAVRYVTITQRRALVGVGGGAQIPNTSGLPKMLE